MLRAADFALLSLPSWVAVLGMLFSPLLREADFEYSCFVTLSVALSFPVFSWRYVRRQQTVKTLFAPIALGLLLPTLCASYSFLVRPACGGFTAPLLYLLEVTPTALYGVLGGASLALLFKQRCHRLQGFLLVAFILGHCATAIGRLYLGPAVFFYDHLLGYFPGSLYDERIEITKAFLTFRLVTLIRIVGLSLFIWAQENGVLCSPRRFAVGVVGLSCLDLIAGPASMYRISWRALRTELPVSLTRSGLTLHLPSETPSELAEAVLADHLFRIEQIRRKLGAKAPQNIHSYVYRDSSHKSRWMGCRNTLVAKPWQKAMHTHPVSRFAEPVAHELVHLLLAPYASAPLSLTTHSRLWPNMGIVEGMAEVCAAPRGPLDVHAQAQALQAAGRAWLPSELLAPQAFWSQAPGRAYPIVGSFLSFLRDAYGNDKLLSLYRAGDFSKTYHRSLKSLEQEWQNALDRRPLAPEERALAYNVGRVPSLFCRRCPHQAARLRAQVSRADAAGRERLFAKICAFEDNNPTCRAEQAFAHAAFDGGAISRQIFSNLEPEFSKLSRQIQAEVMLAEIRSFVQERDIPRARRRLWALLSDGPSSDIRRQATLMQSLLDFPESEPFLLVFTMKSAEPSAFPGQYVPNEQAPLLANLTAFVAGRNALKDAEFHQAVHLLVKAEGRLPPILEEERQLMLARAAFFAGDFGRATDALQAACAHLFLSGELARCADFQERIDFARAQAET